VANNPGSPEAVKAGCTCPQMDNGHGEGRADGNFVIDAACPIHGHTEERIEDIIDENDDDLPDCNDKCTGIDTDYGLHIYKASPDCPLHGAEGKEPQ
jgi:hypothetical protein